jgi:hypothetical protein
MSEVYKTHIPYNADEDHDDAWQNIGAKFSPGFGTISNYTFQKDVFGCTVWFKSGTVGASEAYIEIFTEKKYLKANLHHTCSQLFQNNTFYKFSFTL